MVLIIKRLFAALALLVIVSTATPAAAHRRHDHGNTAQEAQPPGAQASDGAAPHGNTPGAMHEAMQDHAEEMEEQRPTTFGGRVMRFLGQMHPFAVHFPIALFPVTWLALIFARRRGHATDLVRAAIIVAGIAAVGAGALGWLSAGFAAHDPDPLLTAHRWTGTILALFGALLAWWAWRRGDSVNGRAMPWLLAAATVVLLAQGFMGAVLVHGWEHMSF